MRRVLWMFAFVLLAGCASPDQTEAPLQTHSTTEANIAVDTTHQAGMADILVAWTTNGALYTWMDGTLHELGGEDLTQPTIAPDGHWIAAVSANSTASDALWIAAWPDGPARLLTATASLDEDSAARNLLDVVWSPDSSVLYANTRTGSGITTRSADDLWQIDPSNGAITRLLPDGQGGTITPSPNGRWLALASAGEYADAPGALHFYEPATGQIRTALTYPAVATASEWRWHAEPYWAPDGSGVLVAIPPVDLVYGGDYDSAEQLTALWWVPLDGTPEQIGTINAHFFGLPRFSADGTWLAAMQPQSTTGPNAIALVLAARDGSTPTIYMQGEIGTLSAPEWLPTGQQFTVVRDGPGSRWIGQPDATPERFPSDAITAQDVRWVDGETFVFSNSTADGFALYLGAWQPDARNRAAPQLIAQMPAYPRFDARRIR